MQYDNDKSSILSPLAQDAHDSLPTRSVADFSTARKNNTKKDIVDFLIGLLIIFILAYLISGAVQFACRKPYTCACGWQCYSEEELLAHILSKNIHKMVE